MTLDQERGIVYVPTGSAVFGIFQIAEQGLVVGVRVAERAVRGGI